AGYRRPLPEQSPGFDRRFGKGATVVSPEQLEVDLHRRLAIGRFGVRLPTDVLFEEPGFERPDPLPLAGRTLPALGPPARLLHACYHAALGGFRHVRVHRDIAQLLLVSDAAWPVTVELAARHRVDV